MSATAVARGVIALIAAGAVLVGSARANDAAHKMAEKFAAGSDSANNQAAEAERKAAEAKKRDKEKSEAARKEADRKAAEAKKLAAEKKAAEARKREAEAKRKAAEARRRAAEQREVDEADMLARARREADEMRAAEEHDRLAREARRLIEEAEKERAKAEALLARLPAQDKTTAGETEKLAQQRMEETRRLAEKLRRVRQIHDARIAAQQQRAGEQSAPANPAAIQPEPVPSVVAATPQKPPAPAADQTLPAATPDAAPVAERPPQTAHAPSADAPPPVIASAPPPAPVATSPPAAAPPPAPPASPPVASASIAPPPAATAAPLPRMTQPAARLTETRVAVLLILEPGTYGIRRRGPKTADPVLCVSDGCYVSAGAAQPARFLPARRALGFGNTFGARAGACRQSLGCIFRNIELGSLPGYLQPVDLHILRHDRRSGHMVLTDSSCVSMGGRLSCTHGIYAEDYTMWILPESLADAVGPEVLSRALSEGLNGPRSAQLMPR